MGHGFAEKAIFLNKKMDSPKIMYKNVQYSKLGHMHKPKFGLVFVLWPFYHHFCTKTDNIVFQFAMSECH